MNVLDAKESDMTNNEKISAVNHLERRERIATAAMQALLVGYERSTRTLSGVAESAVRAADALIAELDKEPSR